MPHLQPTVEMFRARLPGATGFYPEELAFLDEGLGAHWPLIEDADPVLATSGRDEGPLLHTLGSTGTTFSADAMTNVLGSAVFSGTSYFNRVSRIAAFESPKMTLLMRVKLASKAVNRSMVWYGTVGGSMLLEAGYNSNTDRFFFRVARATGGPQVTFATSLGSPAVDTWYFLKCTIDGLTIAIGGLANGTAFAPVFMPYVDQNNIVFPRGHSSGTPPVMDSQVMTSRSAAAGGYLTIGYGALSSATPLVGKLGQIGLWTRGLNNFELAMLYYQPLRSTFFLPASELGHIILLPDAPTALDVSEDTPNIFTVSFEDENSGTATHEVWRDDALGEGFELLATLAAGVETFDDPTGTVAHSYKVRASRSGWHSAFVTFAGTPAPDAPTAISISQVESNLLTGYTHPAQFDPTLADSYQFDRNYQNDSWEPMGDEMDVTQTATTLPHGIANSGLNGSGHDIQVRVRAVKDGIYSAWAYSNTIDLAEW